MVRNEHKILKRCLESVKGVVDAFCIHDTGSTDATCSIAQEFLKENNGCLTKSTWKDFGYNRTQSFKEAQNWLKSQQENLGNTYGLLLDADMEFVSGKLKEQDLKELGYTMIQSAGNLDYPNCRLVRMDYPWVCRGVTHEYWDGKTAHLSKDICHINDHNDGGCKSDKFTRDLALLHKGLEEDPRNVRYMFYLAQTYHSLQKWEEAIKWYTKRIDAGGWFEEVWYSMYMISKTHLTLGNTIEAEVWVQKAFAYRPGRAEVLYHFVKHLRLKSEHYKAMHYLNLGKNIPLSTDALFVEKDVYDGLFLYEETLLRFYTQSTLLDGLKLSIAYLMKESPPLEYAQNVLSNIIYYIEPLKSEVVTYPMIRDFIGFDYHPSSVSVYGNIINVRFVNYLINHVNGSYTMKDGKYDTNNQVRTQNVVVINGIPKLMDDSSVTLPRHNARIKGLEDVRLYLNSKGELSFTATSAEYSDNIRIIRGRYRAEEGKYSDCVLMNSPLNQDCEKNWLPIDGTEDMIYRWNPLEIGKAEGAYLKIHTKHKTPWFFSHFRGSAVPVKFNNELWALVHFVEHSTPRKYFHCFVVLDPNTYKPKRTSTPFVFRQKTIEYCLGLAIKGTMVNCFVSTMDDNPVIVAFDLNQLSWWFHLT